MEIPSGGTPGPRLADEWRRLDNNVYGVLRDSPEPRRLAELLVAAGWRARASSWTEYEVECEWVGVELSPGTTAEVIVSGVVDPSRLDELAAVFAGLGTGYSIELWEPGHRAPVRELSGVARSRRPGGSCGSAGGTPCQADTDVELR